MLRSCSPAGFTRLMAVVSLLLFCVSAFAQGNGNGQKPTTVKHPDVSPPTYPKIIDVDLRDLPRKAEWAPGQPIKEIPKRVYHNADEIKPKPQRDSLVDNVYRAPTRALSGTVLNYAGQGFTGVNPPDTVGDVGKDYYIQSINGGGGALYVIYNKSDGSVAAGPFSMESLGTGNCGSGLGDPIILYDELAERWMISEFSSSGNLMCVYVSQTSNPITGGWFNYSFQGNSFPDYPKYGVWPDAYYVGTNESTLGLYAFDRNAMLAGNPATSQRFSTADLSGFGFQMIQPADLDGTTAPPANSPGIFMRHRDTEVHSGISNPSGDYLEIFEFTVDFNNSSNSSLTGPTLIEIAEIDSSLCGLTSFNCFPQPGTATTLDPLREVVMQRLVYRNFGTHETLVGCLVTDVNGSDLGGIRWFELRNTGSGWTLFQEGTYSPDSVNRWMGAIAMDASGNIAVGYNVSDSTSTFPGLRYAGRLSTDPLGTLGQGEFTIVNGTASNGSNRYGDYSAMSVDPVDGCTFWFTGEYNTSSQWSTRIATFAFDECGCTPPPTPTGLSAAANGNNNIDLTWNSVAGADSYRIYRADGTGCPAGSYSLIGTSATTSFSDSTVSGGITYAYVVSAFVTADNCESAQSGCADATATGACTIPPTFAGADAATNLQTAQCAIEVSWSAATANCGTGAVSYNVYRSTTSGFTPGTAIATGVTGLSYTDTTVLNATTYYYIVRAEDTDGNEDTNTNEVSGAASGPDGIGFADDLESGSGNWSVSGSGAGANWTLTTTQANSPTTSFFANDPSSISDRYLDSINISLPAGAPALLQFFHWYNTESSFDGGVLEISTGGAYSDVGAANITENGYNSTISTNFSSPIGGRQAWSGNSGGFIRTTVDLSSYAGNNISLRFRMAADSSVSSTGWWVDDVTVSAGTDCTTGPVCNYSINPTSANFGTAGGSGTITVTADAGCAWTAVSNDAWITITSGASGSGNGATGYSVAANGAASGRTGTITIAGETFTVTQDGVGCSYSINPTSASAAAGGDSGSVSVTAPAGCAWTATSNDAWITVTSGSSGSGNGSVGYSVAANGSSIARSGTITIAGNTFTVNQDGAACTYSINPTSASAAAGGDSGSVSVTAPGGCGWTATSNDAWITVTSGASGSGNGTVGYSVAANGSPSARSGTITIAGNTFTVNQDGLTCNYSINPTSASADAGGDSGSVSVTAQAGCGWTATSNDAWITVTSGASGSGNGSVGYSVAANGSTSARSGTITIAGNTFTVNQAGQSTGVWVTLDSNNFEGGFGNWNDGGSDCRRSARDAAFASQGRFCVRLRDNSGVASSMFTDAFDATPNSELRISFQVQVVSFEGVENFFVEFFDGSSWVIIGDYVVDQDFTENVFFNPSITIDSGSINFATDSRFRIRCDASGNGDRMYVDEALIEGFQ